MRTCLKNLLYIQNNIVKITEKVQLIYKTDDEKPISHDVDQSLYDGFISTTDRKVCEQIQNLSIEEIEGFRPNFEDQKLLKLYLNFKARNYPQFLNDFEQEQWFEIVQSRVQDGSNGFLSLECFERSLYNLKQSSPDKSALWQDLENYSQSFL